MTFTQQPVRPPRTTNQVVDVVMTVVLLVVHGLAFMVSAYISLFFAMATDSCYGECDTAPLTAAFVVTDGGGLLTLALAIIVSIVLLVRRCLAFWVPLVGIAIQIALVVAGAHLASSIM
ncbi:hypothetical protein [Williamsia sp. 1138]|uniref:hypothetical protein n=1 Tax=Williamsia sp. 1138 TaxID=1903117 RepID=UPI00117D3CBB|nr:hypothetical protein [Williamsia sp. 1138]